MPNEPAEPLEPGTPLPWSVWKSERDGEVWDCAIDGANNKFVFVFSRPFGEKIDRDAAYIVEACNNYLAIQSKLSALEEPCVWTYDRENDEWNSFCGCNFPWSGHNTLSLRYHDFNFCPNCQHPISEHREET